MYYGTRHKVTKKWFFDDTTYDDTALFLYPELEYFDADILVKLKEFGTVWLIPSVTEDAKIVVDSDNPKVRQLAEENGSTLNIYHENYDNDHNCTVIVF